MSVLPTFETVFSEKYWPDPVEAPSETKQALHSRHIQNQLDDLAALAAAGILTGHPRERLAEASELDPDNDPRLSEGTILLLDWEGLAGAAHGQRSNSCGRPESAEIPMFNRLKILDEQELQSLAAYLFRQNTEIVETEAAIATQTVIYPYIKGLCAPQAGLHYRRQVSLTAVTPAQNKGSLLRTVSMFDIYGDGLNIVGDTLNFFRKEVKFEPMKIGEVYRFAEDLVRIKSAEICLSGVLEYARKRKKSRAVGRFALSPKLG